VIDAIVFWTGAILVVLGGVLDIIASIGMNKFKNFYLRLHAATVGSIGGGFYPLIGIALITLALDLPSLFKAYVVGVSIVTAILIALASPTGSHVLARATYYSGEVKPEPITVDRLGEDLKK
jgi:multicomponent Na+:H+ antiporter subunit G